MQMKRYAVIREHLGDVLYSPQGPNSVREAFQNEVQHLVDRGVLVEITEDIAVEPAPEPEPEPAPELKAEAAPENAKPVAKKAGKGA